MDESNMKNNNADAIIGESMRPTEQRDVVGFVSTGPTIPNVPEKAAAVGELIDSLFPVDDQQHSVESYLSRPMLLESFIFNSSTNKGQTITSFNIMPLIRTSPILFSWRSKLQGYYGMTATANLKLISNAQPFEQGIVGVSFYPFFTEAQETTYGILDGLAATDIECSLPFKTACPSMLLNVGCESEITLSIPYVGPNTFINLANDNADWGNFEIYCVSPANSAESSTKIDMAAYLYLTDVKLFGASDAFIPQMDRSELDNLYTQDQIDDAELFESNMRNVVCPHHLVGHVLRRKVLQFRRNEIPLSEFSSSEVQEIVDEYVCYVNHFNSELANVNNSIPTIYDLILGLRPTPDFADLMQRVEEKCPFGASMLLMLFDRRNDAIFEPQMDIIASSAERVVEAAGSAAIGEITKTPLLKNVAKKSPFVEDAKIHPGVEHGFSKPNAPATVQRVQITPFGQMQNVDGESTAYKLGAMTSQDTMITPITNDEEDEMNLAKICKRPGYLTSFSWKTSDAQGTPLTWLGARPDCYVWSGNDSFPTPLRFVANFFKFWRGGIRFFFHVGATKFHSGRLRFVYKVGNGETHSSSSSAEPHTTKLLYSQIVDLREGSSFTIDCPYVATTPWQRVPAVKSTSHLNFPVHNGLTKRDYCDLQIFVETPLRAASTASATVDLVVFAAGMDDIEFAAPSVYPWTPITNYSGKNDPLALEPQGKIEETKLAPFSMIQNTKSGGESKGLIHTQVTVGEKINSFRQLIKRYSWIGDVTEKERYDAAVLPFSFHATYYTNTGTQHVTDEWLPTILPLFRFWRGGVRLLFSTQDPNARFRVHYTPTMNFTGMFTNNWPYFSPIQDIEEPRIPVPCSAEFHSRIQGGYEIQFPFYAFTNMCKVGLTSRDNLNFEHYGKRMDDMDVPYGVAFIHKEGQVSVASIYRSAADDFTMSFQLGAPCCRYTTDWAIDR